MRKITKRCYLKFVLKFKVTVCTRDIGHDVQCISYTKKEKLIKGGKAR